MARSFYEAADVQAKTESEIAQDGRAEEEKGEAGAGGVSDVSARKRIERVTAD